MNLTTKIKAYIQNIYLKFANETIGVYIMKNQPKTNFKWLFKCEILNELKIEQQNSLLVFL